MNTNSDLTQGTHNFDLGGSSIRTPYSYEATSGNIELKFISQHLNTRTINLAVNYANLGPAGVNIQSAIVCAPFAGILVGAGGTVDCVVTIPLKVIDLPVAAVQVTLPNSNSGEYSEDISLL